uniref:Uncharacterized protein n=1 Tax=Rhizophora mucronata TaxID=61149 RepID=A0A2P2IS76_RHIMU
MEKTKAPIKAGTTDDLAIVKAAAWAWYEHGSGSEGKRVCEFVPTRTWQVARPSRYRLEAMRMMEEDSMEGSKRPTSVHTDNSLLDSYEIECISRQFEYLSRSSESMFNSKFPDRNLHRQKKCVLRVRWRCQEKEQEIIGQVFIEAWNYVQNMARCGYKSLGEKPAAAGKACSCSLGWLVVDHGRLPISF